MEAENIVVATAEKIFADLADAQTINSDKKGAWKTPLWQALSEAGLPLSWVAEDHGGSGVSLADGFALLGAAGRFAIAVPLAETMLAGWLLSQAKIASPEGEMTVAPAGPRDRVTVNADRTLSGRARGIPFAHEAKHLAVLADDNNGKTSIVLVDATKCRIEQNLNLGGDDSDTVTFDRVRPMAIKPAPQGFDLTSLLLMGAVVRSLQIAGSLESMLDISVKYSNERVAFEKKISKFQAVQHNLAKLAGESAAALAAATSAADAFGSGAPADALYLEAASAKIRCSEAAEKAAAIAHQVHGAIGFTSEHILHRYTLRALAWRDDFGSESHWAVELGRRVAANGADELWPLVASR
ncbi:acyl-CoA dehydrogenase family protein [Bradyrhizobium sp.]|uniref:acyl-CoA dehydrogenase family protein n=1 Tax=Bradyrhizobium sp. TaxID=376 RepID=UPI002D70C321|nr:acyl-CoA dehydrogenase family protein [Bradyrhizobium sp.]HZR76890.1 acyl-CoA dehydrogenase family protein [Bradyrhizobium sp.]